MQNWTSFSRTLTFLLILSCITKCGLAQNATNELILTTPPFIGISNASESSDENRDVLASYITTEIPRTTGGVTTRSTIKELIGDKRVAAVGKLADHESHSSSPSPVVGRTTINITSTLASTTVECNQPSDFCNLLQHVLDRIKTQPPNSTTTVGTTPLTTSQSNAPTNVDNATSGLTTLTAECENDPKICTLMQPGLNHTKSPLPISIIPKSRGLSTQRSTTLDEFGQMLQEVLSRSNHNISTSTPAMVHIETTSPSYAKLVVEVQSHNRSNINVTSVNLIIGELETIMNATSNISFEEAGSILLNISRWKYANQHTVEKSCSVITQMMEKVQHNSTLKASINVQRTIQSLLMTMENIITSSVTRNLSVSTSTIGILSHTVEENITSKFQMSTSGGNIILSHHLFISRVVRISTVVYHGVIGNNLGGQNTFGGAEVSSNVIGVTVDEMNNKSFTPMPTEGKGPFIITLPTNVRKREKRRICSYWNFDNEGWASDGGTVLEKNNTHTTCRFDHLTNFAVLVLYYDDDKKMSVTQDNILMIMTTIGCSISITCLGMTILAFAYLRLISRETILVHGNLSMALLCGQLVLVASDDARNNDIACKVVAMVLHYFFLSSFTWMMVEGIALYLSCTRGLHGHGDMRLKYCFAGWFIPLIIVVISIGAEFPNYGEGEHNSCWLSTDDGLIWAFMGPMLCIILFNIFVLVLVVKVFLSLQTNCRKSEAAKIRGSIRAMVFLLPLLGITWLLSILVPLHPAFHYLFVLGNSLQGMMIFFLHCICNEEIRKKFIEKKRKLNSTQRTFADSDMAGVKRKKSDKSFYDVQKELPSTDRKYAWVA